MVKQEYIDKLINIQGFSVENLNFYEIDGNNELVIRIIRTEKKYKCECGKEYQTYYDSEERLVRDLSFGSYKKVWLSFNQCRIYCTNCGVKTEKFDWIEPRVKYTKRLAASIALSCQETRSLKAIANQYDMHWETVKEIDKKVLEKELPAIGSQSARLIAVDEFSVRKRHSYGTTVVDLEKRSALYVGEGRNKESLSAFFNDLGVDKCAMIEAVAMDMWKPYRKAVKEHCPNATIVYDPFHIIQAYGRDVIDKVRAAEYKKASVADKSIIKGTRYLLLKNKENLNDANEEHIRLRDLLAINNKLNKIYILKDDLKQLWKYRSEAWARKWFKSWYKKAIYSRIDPLKKFARMLKNHMEGILAHCKYKINTGILEGINNKIKVIKRVAYGFRDFDYFALKIRGAFR